MVLAGAEWPPLPGRYFASSTAPMLFVQGTADTWNPPAASMQLYQADTRGRRYYLDLLGVGHLAGHTGALRAMRRAGQFAGAAELVSGGKLPGH